MRIYVASSWRNDRQPQVVASLREHGHEVYDFKNPTENDKGFHWSEIDSKWNQWTLSEYLSGLSHPLAVSGFNRDWKAMQWASCCVLVLPCGRSAHLEAGWFVGNGKPLLILTDKIEPELMYKMADSIHENIESVIARLEFWNGRPVKAI